ncbi:MAG TPA: TonB-dependent receptor [Pedomonas sp.]|uniref:TonB-dependent receptor n=1 Tax=Pedomonas sp. TaxID=2976421 RepID=UPI002F403DA5
MLRFRASLLAATAAVIAMPAAGQEQQDATGLGDIIVTAQKREENLQDVPIAITAMTSDFVQSRDMTSIDRVSGLVPNVKIETNGPSTTSSVITIRGGVQVNVALFYEPSAGLYVDGVYIAKSQGSLFDIADIERVEVLRGPQGTLYGRNTLSGAINVITRKPSGELGGRAEVSYGNYDYRRAKASLDLPQFGIFSAKLSGQIARRDGFVDNVAQTAGTGSGDDFWNYDSRSGLFQLRAEPAETLTLDYSFDISVNDQRPRYSQLVGYTPGGIFDPASPAYAFGGAIFPIDQFVQPRERSSEGRADAPLRDYAKSWGHGLTASLDLGGAELKSITAYRKLRAEDAGDLDGTALPVAQTARLSRYRSFSQELQVTGQTDALSYVFGLYYFDDKGFTLNPQSFFGGSMAFDSRYGFTTEAYAAYSQLDYRLTDQLTLTGGLRYTHEKKTVERFFQVLGAMPVTLIDAPAGTVPAKKFNNVSPTAVVAWEPSSNINLYAKYARGYRSGGFNGETTSVADIYTPYKAENITSYELGLKSRLLDDRIQLNVAVFSNKHSNMQIAVFRAEGSAETSIDNAGGARVKGLEIEAVARPARDLTVRANLGVLDTKYTRYIDAGVDVADNRAFQYVPKTTASAGFDWTVWRGGDMELDLNGDIQFVSRYFTFPFPLRPGPGESNAYNTRSPGRTLVDMRAVLRGIPLGRTEADLTLWGRNLLNENDPLSYIDFGSSFGGLTVAYFPEPRTFGATLGVKF